MGVPQKPFPQRRGLLWKLWHWRFLWFSIFVVTFNILVPYLLLWSCCWSREAVCLLFISLKGLNRSRTMWVERIGVIHYSALKGIKRFFEVSDEDMFGLKYKGSSALLTVNCKGQRYAGQTKAIIDNLQNNPKMCHDSLVEIFVEIQKTIPEKYIF